MVTVLCYLSVINVLYFYYPKTVTDEREDNFPANTFLVSASNKVTAGK
jgi:hypothetical protein